MNASVSIDETDRQIMRALQRRGRLSMQDLASETGLASATCWRRLKALERNGVIDGYKAILNRESVGFSVTAFVHITVQHQDEQLVIDLAKNLSNKPEVLEIYATTGDADYTLRVVARDIADYDRFLQQLFKLRGISQVRSTIALREIKATTDLPV